MKWNEHPLTYKAAAQLYGIEETTPQETAAQVVRILHHATRGEGIVDSVLSSEFNLKFAEANWVENKRPYYNIYPSIIEPFTKVDLSKVDCLQMQLPLLQIMIRLPVGHEIDGVRTIFAAHRPAKQHDCVGLQVSINNGHTIGVEGLTMPVPQTITALLKPGTTIMDRLENGRAKAHYTAHLSNETIDKCFRLVCTLCLLDNNPDLIEPSPIESDREKWEATHNVSLIEKAHRRGKLEWDIGRKIETAPGFRSPHFAIRWMGHGEPKKPVLRPIRGCLVKRKKILEMPTGYLDSLSIMGVSESSDDACSA